MLEDLFYRLQEFVVEVPPLRRRAGDVPELAYHFLDELRAASGSRPTPYWFTGAALDRLMVYGWPGNVRDLRGAVRHAAINARGRECIELDHLPERLRAFQPAGAVPREAVLAATQWAFAVAAGDRDAAARRLGVHRNTIRYRLEPRAPSRKPGRETR
jgi:two-component system response regulator HydG